MSVSFGTVTTNDGVWVLGRVKDVLCLSLFLQSRLWVWIRRCDQHYVLNASRSYLYRDLFNLALNRKLHRQMNPIYPQQQSAHHIVHLRSKAHTKGDRSKYSNQWMMDLVYAYYTIFRSNAALCCQESSLPTHTHCTITPPQAQPSSYRILSSHSRSLGPCPQPR